MGGVVATGPMRTRTVAVLTRELVAGDLPARIGVRTGLFAAGEGFSGFLVGAGGGRLDHRAAAMVQGASGEGGGILCTYEADGRRLPRAHRRGPAVRLRPPPRHCPRRPTSPPALEEDVELVLELIPRGRGRLRLRLTGTGGDGATLAAARLRRVDGAALTGGISPVSSSRRPTARARHWFAGLGTAGAKVARRPERAEGPASGTLTLNGAVLKLTAQRRSPSATATSGSAAADAAPRWRLGDAGVALVGPGFAAAFPGHRLGRRRRPRLPGPVGPAAPRSRRSKAPWPPTWRATASCGSGCSTAPSTATGR